MWDIPDQAELLAEYLLEKHGITTMQQLNEAIKRLKPLDISIFCGNMNRAEGEYYERDSTIQRKTTPRRSNENNLDDLKKNAFSNSEVKTNHEAHRPPNPQIGTRNTTDIKQKELSQHTSFSQSEKQSSTSDIRFVELLQVLKYGGYTLYSFQKDRYFTYLKPGCPPITVPLYDPINKVYIQLVKEIIEYEDENRDDLG